VSDAYDVRHWSLVQPDRLAAAGFMEAYAAMYLTDDFQNEFGRAGRSLLVTALLFRTPHGAEKALRVFAASRRDAWKKWRPLAPVGGASGIAQTGRLGSDNVSDLYPSTGFLMQVANVCLMVGSQGGSTSGRPLPERFLRSLATRMWGRAQHLLTVIDTPSSPSAVGKTSDQQGPVDQPRPDLDEPAGVAMDTQSGRVVACDAGSGATWTFDVRTNSWQRMRPARRPALGRWARMVYDAGADLTVAFPVDGNTPWTYSVETDTWAKSPVASSSPETFWTLTDLVYHPVSRRVLLRDSATADLWSYALEANTWTQLAQGTDVPPADDEELAHSLLAYDSATDRLVLALLAGEPGAATWTFDPGAATWNRQTARPPSVNTSYFESGGEMVFDAARGVTVLFTDGVLATYDATADMWNVVAPGPGWPSLHPVDGMPTGPLARLGHSLVYDDVNERIVLFGGHARMLTAGGDVVWRDLDDVWAYDVSTNTWLELVPARRR
jgi:hypothetical protein